jgi:cell division transport system permease protein
MELWLKMARIKSKKPNNKMAVYLISHLRAALFSLGRIMRAPFASLITILVIAITLTLPATLFVLLQNGQQLSASWNNKSTQISLYLKSSISQEQVSDVVHQLKADPEIANVRYISPDQGLQEFKQALGADQIINGLTANPLPAVIVVQPILSLRSAAAIEQLVNNLQQLSEVSVAQLDMHWLERLANIINLAENAILALALLLGFGVLLIIGNTIRLATQNDRKEIAVLKLVGATNSFIRRPFLYSGIWLGFFGGLVAWLLVDLIIWWLKAPVAKLAASYSSSFYLHNLPNSMGLNLIIVSLLLGFVGAWVVVGRSLRHYQ